MRPVGGRLAAGPAAAAAPPLCGRCPLWAFRPPYMVTLRDGTAPRGAPVRGWLLAARFPRPQRPSLRYRRGHPARCAGAVASSHG